MAPPEPVRAVARAVGRYRRVSRTVAAVALLYSIALILTGGFDIVIAGLCLRSHEINRFVTIAVIAGLLDIFASERALELMWSFAGRIASAVVRALPAVVGLVACGVALWTLLGIVAGFVRPMTPETPFADMALLELYTRQAVANTLLVGPYSRFLWHHPGPAMFYLLRPLYQRSGERYESLRWSALVFNLICLGVLIEIVRRHAKPILTWTIALGVTFYLYRFPDLLASPWNPHLLVLPLGLLLVALAAILDGEPRGWPFVVVVGSFLIQTHLSVAPTVGAAVLTTMAWLVARTPEAELARRHRWWMGVSLPLLVVMWALPLAEQLSSPVGNFTAIYESFFQKPLPAPPLGDAVAASLNMLSAAVVPGLIFALGGLVVKTVSVTGVIVAVGSMFAAPWTAKQLARQDDQFGMALAALSLVASLAAIWSVARIQGEILDQLIFWITMVGRVTVMCLTAAVVSALTQRMRPAHWRMSPLATIALAALAVIVSASYGVNRLYAAHDEASNQPIAQKVRAATASLEAYLSSEDLRWPLVRIAQPAWGDAAGVVLALQKAGRPVSIEPKWIFMYGTQHRASGDEDCEVVFADAAHEPALERDSRFVRVGVWPELSIHVMRLTPRSSSAVSGN